MRFTLVVPVPGSVITFAGSNADLLFDSVAVWDRDPSDPIARHERSQLVRDRIALVLASKTIEVPMGRWWGPVWLFVVCDGPVLGWIDAGYVSTVVP